MTKPNSEQCELCKFAVTYLDTFLEKNATQAEIEAFLEKMCSEIVPSKFKQQCLSLVTQYGPLIVQLLEAGLQPDKVCTAIGLCSANKQEAQKITALATASPVPKIGKQKTTICALCEAVLQYLENRIEKNATKEKIISVLSKMCGLLPGKDKEICIQSIPMYTGYVVDLIEKELPPSLICTFAKICIDDEVAVSMNQAPVKKTEVCLLCRIVITEVYKILEENATKKDAVAALDKVCNILPSLIKSECLQFVGLYLPYVIDLIVQKETPDLICQKLKICTAAVKLEGQSQVAQMNALSSVKSGATCTVCLEVFQVLDIILQNPSTEAEIEKALDRVCIYLPTFKDECVQIIAEYTPFAVDLITKKFTPKQICNEIHLCTNGTAALSQPSQSLMFQSEISTTAPPFMEYCSACKFALYEIQTALEDPVWQNKSKDLLYELCALLPSGQEACQQLVDANFVFILNEILSFRFPIVVCQVIGLCEPPAPALNGDNGCMFCKGLAMKVNYYAQQNKTVDEVKELAASTCLSNQRGTVNQCVSIVNKYTPQLFRLMSQESDPASACEAATFCTRPSQGKLYKALRPGGEI